MTVARVNRIGSGLQGLLALRSCDLRDLERRECLVIYAEVIETALEQGGVHALALADVAMILCEQRIGRDFDCSHRIAIDIEAAEVSLQDGCDMNPSKGFQGRRRHATGGLRSASGRDFKPRVSFAGLGREE